jgi:cytochrome c peroxidase
MSPRRVLLKLIPVMSWALPSFASPLGLPPVPVPGGNPVTPAKVTLGDKLFNDKRFSATGQGEPARIPPQAHY